MEEPFEDTEIGFDVYVHGDPTNAGKARHPRNQRQRLGRISQRRQVFPGPQRSHRGQRRRSVSGSALGCQMIGTFWLQAGELPVSTEPINARVRPQ